MSLVKDQLMMHSTRTMMSVGFSELTIRCSIGILPHERLESQEVVLSLKVFLSEMQKSDEMHVDYAILAALCKTIACSKHRDLLETLSLDLMNAIAAQFSCARIWIRIEKPSAIPHARCAFVEYETELA